MHLFALSCIRDACGGFDSSRLVVYYGSLMQQETPARDTSPKRALSLMEGEGRKYQTEYAHVDKQIGTRGLRRVKRPGFDILLIAIAKAE